MHTILLVTHIISMVVSMVLMSTALVYGFRGRDTAAHVATVGMIATAFGAMTGAVLLLFAPILSECVILTAYLSAVSALYIFGFGSGFADQARLIRRTASIQNAKKH